MSIVNVMWREMFEHFGIEAKQCPTYSLWSNTVKRENKSVGELLRALGAGEKYWPLYLAAASCVTLLQHRATQMTPFYCVPVL